MTLAPPADARTQLAEILAAALHEVARGHSDVAIVLERPKRAGHGDYGSNVALQLAKPLPPEPRDIAIQLVAALPRSAVLEKAEVAGAGFINLFLRRDFK